MLLLHEPSRIYGIRKIIYLSSNSTESNSTIELGLHDTSSMRWKIEFPPPDLPSTKITGENCDFLYVLFVQLTILL